MTRRGDDSRALDGRRLTTRLMLVTVVLVLSGVAFRARGRAIADDAARGVVGRGYLGNSGKIVHVTPDGTASGDGSAKAPLDLTTALGRQGPAAPGDSVWLGGGRYRGTFASELTGSASAPITVRPAPGEHAIIDSAPSNETALTIKGAWTMYWDLEITSSSPDRVSAQTGSHVTDIHRGTGVEVHGAHTKILGFVVHDLATGIGMWSDAEDAEAYGNIIFNNGWTAADRNHGHGIYTQNRVPTRRITDNIVFNQFSMGIHAYGTAAASLDNLTIEGNTVFNNGVLDPDSFDRNILLGGGQLAHNPVLKNNDTYYTPQLRDGGGENTLGYVGGCSNLIVEGNYWVHWGAGYPMTLSNCAGRIQGNLFYGYMDPTISAQYPDNVYTITRPAGVRTTVRPNPYLPGRASITIYNWDGRRTVPVDLAGAGVDSGDEYELRDVQDYFGPPVLAGTRPAGPVAVPMDGRAVTKPIGMTAPPHTPAEFGVFTVVVTKRSEGPATQLITLFKAGLLRLRAVAARAF